MPKLNDLTGKTFGNWVVLERMDNYKTPNGNTYTQWRCQCKCGSSPKGVLANALLSGKSTSCGCMRKKHQQFFCRENFTTHGESNTRLYKIWAGIKKRCLNQTSSNYRNYGGRGISICSEWLDFVTFKDWAIHNGYTDESSIDRIDVNGNYSPDNCRWVDRITQANNRRTSTMYTLNGETHTLAEWARIYNVNYKMLHKKVRYKNIHLADALQSS